MRNQLLSAILQSLITVGFMLAGTSGLRAEEPSHLIREFHLSAEHSGPSVVFADKDGSVWVALARAGRIARFKGDALLREYNLPSGTFPVGLVRDTSHYLYVSDIKGNGIVQVDIDSASTREFPIVTANSWPFFLSIASDGRIWFTERVGNKIGALDPVSGVIKEYKLSTEQAQPAGLTVTRDDQVYFTENTGHKVGHLNPKTGLVNEQNVPSKLRNSPYYGLAGITSDANGDVWFSELDGRICQIDRHHHAGADAIREFTLPNPIVRPAGLVVDRWGIVWFTELDGNGIGSYNPSLQVFDEYVIPTGKPDPAPMGPPEATARGELPTVGFRARTSRPFGIAVDNEGKVWFSEQYANQVARVDVPELRIFEPTGRVTAAQAPLKVQVRTLDPHPIVTLEINGATFPFGHSVDLTQTTGGDVTLRASLKTQAKASEATSSFVYDPSVDALRQALLDAKRAGTISADLYANCLHHIDAMATAQQARNSRKIHDIEEDMIRVLGDSQGQNARPEMLLSQLKWQDRFGSRDQTILENSSQAAAITVEAGDSLEWKTTSEKDSKLRVEPCEARSEALTYTQPTLNKIVFHKPGSFAFSLNGGGNCNGVVTVVPRETLIEEFPLPNKDSVPGVLAADASGNVWFTEGGGGYSKLAAVPLNNKIGCLHLDGSIQEYSTPTMDSAPTSIHIGAEGHVWFTERAGNNLGELIPETGEIHEYAIPTPRSGTTGITVDHHGIIWFASKGSSKIGYFDPQTKEIQEIDTPTPASQPSTITVDGDNNIWFDERANDKIVRYQVAGKHMTEFLVPTRGSRTVGLVPDQFGNIYFLELGANKVGKLDIATGYVTEYQIPTSFASPFKEAMDEQGRLWFTEVFGNKIGMLDNGKFTEYEIPTAEAMPGGITRDLRGNLWFSEQAGNKIARIPALYNRSTIPVYAEQRQGLHAQKKGE